VKLTLTRFCYAPHATFGQIRFGDGLTIYTVEKPWQDNEPFLSCIPEGTYRCTWQPTTTSVPASFNGHTWYVEGGNGLVGLNLGVRTRIAWHKGNTSDDVQGCIAVGQRLGTVSGKWAVVGSQDALIALRSRLPDEFELEIKLGMAA